MKCLSQCGVAVNARSIHPIGRWRSVGPIGPWHFEEMVNSCCGVAGLAGTGRNIQRKHANMRPVALPDPSASNSSQAWLRWDCPQFCKRLSPPKEAVRVACKPGAAQSDKRRRACEKHDEHLRSCRAPPQLDGAGAYYRRICNGREAGHSDPPPAPPGAAVHG